MKNYTNEEIYNLVKITREVAEHLKEVEFESSYALRIDFLDFTIELNHFIRMNKMIEEHYKKSVENEKLSTEK